MVASVYLFYSFKYIKSQFLYKVCQKKVSTFFGLFTYLHLWLLVICSRVDTINAECFRLKSKRLSWFGTPVICEYSER